MVKIHVEAPLKWIDAYCKDAKYTGELVLTDREFEEFKANPHKFFKANQVTNKLNLEFDETVINKQGPIGEISYNITGTSIKPKQKKVQKEFTDFEDGVNDLTKTVNNNVISSINSPVQIMSKDDLQGILDYIKKEENYFNLLPDTDRLERGIRNYALKF